VWCWAWAAVGLLQVVFWGGPWSRVTTCSDHDRESPLPTAGAGPLPQLPDTAVLNINGAASKQAAGGPQDSGGALGALGSTLGQLSWAAAVCRHSRLRPTPSMTSTATSRRTYPDPKGNYPGGIVVSK